MHMSDFFHVLFIFVKYIYFLMLFLLCFENFFDSMLFKNLPKILILLDWIEVMIGLSSYVNITCYFFIYQMFNIILLCPLWEKFLDPSLVIGKGADPGSLGLPQLP